MPLIYLSKELYDQLVRMHEEPAEFANKAVREKLENVKDVK